MRERIAATSEGAASGGASCEVSRPQERIPSRGCGTLLFLVGSGLVLSDPGRDHSSIKAGVGLLLILMGTGLFLDRLEQAGCSA